MRAYTRALAVVGAALALPGCASVSLEASHTSHPLRGAPFGPEYEEDTLDTVGVVARKEYGRAYVEHGLAYRLRDGGFKGDDFIYYGRVGVYLYRR